MSNSSIQVAIEAKRRRLKVEYGQKAGFVSNSGLSFNVFDAVWLLAPAGNSGEKIYLEWLDGMGYDEELECDIRFALATIAKTKAYQTIKSIASALKVIGLPEFTLIALQTLWPTLLDSHKRNLRIFWHYLPETKYGMTHSWLQSLKIPQSRSRVYDPKIGALSDIENHSFNVALGRYINASIDNGFPEESRPDRAQTVGPLTSFSSCMAVRLMQTLVRRPVNLQQLKWSDILPVGVSFNDVRLEREYDFSDEEELQVRMWKAKQNNNFRCAVERQPMLLHSSIAQEVLVYRLEYARRLQKRFDYLGLMLNKSEFDEIFMRCPFLFDASLFNVTFESKTVLFNAIGKNSEGFHRTAASITACIAALVNRLELKSDRVAAFDLNISNNRIRHTVGTNGAKNGLSVLQIAKLLGNSPKAAKVYIDMSNEQRANIDKKFVANEMLIKAFSTSVDELKQSNEFVIEDEFGHEAGQSKSLRICGSCTENRPIGCYGCANFAALLEGAHRDILDVAKKTYKHRLDMGWPESSLSRLENQIKYIQATICICDEMLTERSALND
jgi:predicted transcriptional regulator